MLPSTLLSAVALATAAEAHILISYPGSRGNNLIQNETFPFGMQWMYPCGGMRTTTNRTFWPTTGGAVAFQPGWFQGHRTAIVHINLGFGTDGPDNGPRNMSNPMLPPVQLLGPTNNPYPGTVCFPQVSLPVNASVKAGDNATIQVVELAVHGAALFSCVDITFAEPNDPRIAEVNESNCFNSQEIGFADIYTITTVEPRSGDPNQWVSSAPDVVHFWYFNRHRAESIWVWAGWLPVILGGLWVWL